MQFLVVDMDIVPILLVPTCVFVMADFPGMELHVPVRYSFV